MVVLKEAPSGGPVVWVLVEPGAVEAEGEVVDLVDGL